MKKLKERKSIRCFNWEGTREEIGRQMAENLEIGKVCFQAPEYITSKDIKDGLELFATHCPGLEDEIVSYANAANVSVEEIGYLWLTYLIPRCSSLAVLGNRMEDGHAKLIRNYEFSLDDEDLTVCRTAVTGKYTHIGGSIATFGRCEGINECGLAISMTSCGIPVGNAPGMRPASLKGLHFWAVIRTILEDCKNVKEALQRTQTMPIAFNIKLYLADAEGNAALLETLNGVASYEMISEESKSPYLFGTNHAMLPAMNQLEPMIMKNSSVRYQKLKEFMETHEKLQEYELQELFLAPYPEGMTAFYYDEWFGTIKTVLMDTQKCSYKICWFGQEENGWEEYLVTDTLKVVEEQKIYAKEKGNKEFFAFIHR